MGLWFGRLTSAHAQSPLRGHHMSSRYRLAAAPLINEGLNAKTRSCRPERRESRSGSAVRINIKSKRPRRRAVTLRPSAFVRASDPKRAERTSENYRDRGEDSRRLRTRLARHFPGWPGTTGAVRAVRNFCQGSSDVRAEAAPSDARPQAVARARGNATTGSSRMPVRRCPAMREPPCRIW